MYYNKWVSFEPPDSEQESIGIKHYSSEDTTRPEPAHWVTQGLLRDSLKEKDL